MKPWLILYIYIWWVHSRPAVRLCEANSTDGATFLVLLWMTTTRIFDLLSIVEPIVAAGGRPSSVYR